MPVQRARILVISLAAAVVPALLSCGTPTRAAQDAAHGWLVFGAMPSTSREANPEVTAESAPGYADSGELVVLTGTVSDVCRTMGCWLEIKSGATDGRPHSMLVMNKDHDFFVPRNCIGKPVHAVGRVIVETHSVEMLRHLAQDAGKTQAEIDAISAPEKRVIFIADAVIMPGEGLDPPVRTSSE